MILIIKESDQIYKDQIKIRFFLRASWVEFNTKFLWTMNLGFNTKSPLYSAACSDLGLQRKGPRFESR
jgi:hypothetical protein